MGKIYCIWDHDRHRIEHFADLRHLPPPDLKWNSPLYVGWMSIWHLTTFLFLLYFDSSYILALPIDFTDFCRIGATPAMHCYANFHLPGVYLHFYSFSADPFPIFFNIFNTSNFILSIMISSGISCLLAFTSIIVLP